MKLEIDLDASKAMAEIRDLMEDLKQQMVEVTALPIELLQEAARREEIRQEDVRASMKAFSERMTANISRALKRNM